MCIRDRTAAKAVYANTSATQTEVDRAASTLLDALAAMAERADPVSYTHLDVYKRQAL